MGSQRVGHDWVTELNWTELNIYLKCLIYQALRTQKWTKQSSALRKSTFWCSGFQAFWLWPMVGSNHHAAHTHNTVFIQKLERKFLEIILAFACKALYFNAILFHLKNADGDSLNWFYLANGSQPLVWKILTLTFSMTKADTSLCENCVGA